MDNLVLAQAACLAAALLPKLMPLLGLQRTLREATAATADYLHLARQTAPLVVETDGSVTLVRVVPGTPPPAAEGALALVHHVCKGRLGAAWHPRAVSLVHGPRSGIAAYQAHFGCVPEFEGPYSGFEFRSAALNGPNPTAFAAGPAPQGAGGSALTAAAPSSHDRVRHALQVLLPCGQAGIDAVSQGLGVSPRTLQRQLEAEGHTFSGVLQSVRRDLARDCLSHTQLPLHQLAHLLGYVHASAFNRWFSGEFGTTPRQWRRGGASSLS